MIKSFKDLTIYISADLYRYFTSARLKDFVRGWFIPGFRFTFLLRCTQYLAFSRWHILYLPIYLIFRLMLRHYQFKYGISIHHTTSIGPGLYIGHFGEIIVNPSTTIGKNCNLSPGVLLGHNYNKQTGTFEYPAVGDFVVLCNNAKIIGGCKLGNNSAVAVGAVVNKDVAERAIVAGVPAKVISYDGSEGLCGSFHPHTLTVQ